MEMFLTARLQSTRLPRKHLLPIHDNATSIRLLIERLSSVAMPIVGVIPRGAADDELESAFRGAGVEVFRGDPENVLLRYQEAFEARGGRHAIIVDGDDLFVSRSAIRRAAEADPLWDVVRTAALPFGGTPTRLSARALRALLDMAASPDGWSRCLERIDAKQHLLTDQRFSTVERTYRLTLDTDTDYRFLKEIYSRCYQGQPIGLGTAVAEVSRRLAYYRQAYPACFLELQGS